MLFNAKLGVRAGLFTCVWDSQFPTFDSESFELELNGRAWDTSGFSFVQIPSVFLEIRLRSGFALHVHHERTTCTEIGVGGRYGRGRHTEDHAKPDGRAPG